ncbi:MAG: FapA family protein [Spirochaetota bacterium]
MKRPANYSLKNLISSTEELLGEIGEIEELTAELSSETEEKLKSDFRKKLLKENEESFTYQVDGYAEIMLSDDEMTATADFYPPSEGKKPIELDYVTELLDIKSVCSGVDWDIIKKTVFECNLMRKEIRDVIIARGLQPVDEVPEHLVIEEKLLVKTQEPDLENKRVDFRNINPFVFVKEGDVLARLSPKKKGTPGTTVRGKMIPYYTKKVHQLKAGRNTRREGDGVSAGLNGRFEYDEDSFWVNEVLELAGDVDYKTGHISFPGDIIINGEIKDGFKVHSGGSIYCKKTMDASEVISGKDLFVNWGIIGKKKGSVKVKGSIRSKFIENCYVEAGGSLFVEVGILHSMVHSIDVVELGKKGIIIGGSIHAQNRVIAAQIGSAFGPRTEIHCGTDYTVKQKIEWIKEKNIALSIKLKQIREKLSVETVHGESLIEALEKIQNAIHKLNQAAGSLIFQLDKNEEAEIIVTNTVFPGVYIEICHVSYIVSRQMSHIRFKLDKAKGKIIAEPLLRR